MTYLEQKTALLNNFYENYYYPLMKRGGPLEVEFIVSPKCNLACKYCYVNKFYHKTYPDEIYNPTIVRQNIMKVLKAYTKKGLAPDIEIFSGEFFSQQIGYDVLDDIYNYYKDLPLELRPSTMCIPTNCTFICSEELTQKVGEIIQRYWSIDIMLYLSASVEGLYLEENRPHTHNIDIDLDVVRDQAYYDRLCEFCNQYGFGYHPMVAAQGIEKWIQNFDWWQEQFKKHGIEWDSIYLLEVRDGADAWTPQQIAEYQKFLRHIFYFAYNKFENKKEFLGWMLGVYREESGNVYARRVPSTRPSWDEGFNILMSPFTSNSNGIGCNIQQHTAIRCADLAIYPCHRLMYEPHLLGKYKIDDEYNITIEPEHVELAVTLPLMDQSLFAKCSECPINQLCGHGCLGSQYETTKDLLTPCPNICNLNYAKIATLIDCLKEVNLYTEMLGAIDNQLAKQTIAFENYRRNLNHDKS